jgi:citrate synthase
VSIAPSAATTPTGPPPPPPGFKAGLEGHIAFRTEIAEPDKDGGSLRYRGVDIEDLVGHVTFGNVWALLVDGRFGPGLPPAEPFPIPVHTGDVRVDVQAALAMLAPYWGYRPLLDTSLEEAREQLARASVMALSYVAQSARGIGVPAVPQERIDRCTTITERFMTRWRGEPDPAHIKAVDAYWVSAAEHGLNASTWAGSGSPRHRVMNRSVMVAQPSMADCATGACEPRADWAT